MTTNNIDLLLFDVTTSRPSYVDAIMGKTAGALRSRAIVNRLRPISERSLNLTMIDGTMLLIHAPSRCLLSHPRIQKSIDKIRLFICTDSIRGLIEYKYPAKPDSKSLFLCYPVALQIPISRNEVPYCIGCVFIGFRW